MNTGGGIALANPFGIESDDLRPDPAALAAFWERFTIENATYEVRCPHTRRGPLRWYGTAAGYFTDAGLFVQHVARVTGDDAPGVYITLNPVNPELRARASNRLLASMKATTGDDQITARRRLLFDFDPVRPADIAANAAELAAALAIRDQCEALLTDIGWPAPLYRLMTGNGGALVYAIDLPNDDDATGLVRACLAAAAETFNSATVSVDQSVCNAARITRIPGTINAKGDSDAELGRVWRRVIAEYPSGAGTVSREQLEVLAALAPSQTAEAPIFTWEPADGRTWQVGDKLTAAGVGFDERTRPWGTLYRLDRCLTSDAHTDGVAIFERSDGRLGYRCHHNGCADKHWADVRSALGLESPRGTGTGCAADGDHFSPGKGGDDAASTSSSNNESRATDWPDALASEAFHGLAGEIVRAVEPYSEADSMALLAHCLAGVGALVGPAVHAVAGDARHPARLNAVCVGQSSKGRKGSSARPIERLLALADSEFAPGRVAEGLSSGEGLIWAVRDPIQRYERAGQGANRRSELIEVDPGVEDKRLWVLEAEFASVLRVIQRDGNTLSALVRRAWDSGDLRTLTKNSPAVATGAHINIVGHVTRDELLRYLDRTELASGFANRFLWFAVRRARLLPDGAEVPRPLLEHLAAKLRQVASWAANERVLVRNAEASALWHEVYPMLVRDQAGLFGAATSRAEAQVLRLSVIYAILDRADAIGAEHLLGALAVWRHAEQSARWIFEDSLGDPTADTLLAALRRSGPLSRNDIVNLFGRNLSQSRIDRALGLLLAAGLVRRSQDRDTGGRPREVWHAV